MRVKRSSNKKLAAFKRTYRTDALLLGAVERHVVTRTLTDEHREAHAIHPSEIVRSDACKRAMYYRMVDTPMDLDNIDTSFWRERIFEEGHDIHDKWQRWLWEMGKLYGMWECLQCDYRWYGRSPTECVKCGAGIKKLRYREVPIEDKEHMIVGSADGQVDEGLIEIKSVGLGTVRIEAPAYYDRFMSGEWNLQQLWNEIKRPFPAHTRQAMLYAFCKGVQNVIIIYECKWNQAVKEFHIGFTEEIIAPVLDACLDLKYAVKKHKPMPRPKWADEESPICMACPYKKECWNASTSEAQDGERKRLKVRVKST